MQPAESRAQGTMQRTESKASDSMHRTLSKTMFKAETSIFDRAESKASLGTMPRAQSKALVPELVLQLGEDSWRTRRNAAEKLGQIEDETTEVAMNRMRACLSDGNLRVRRAGAKAMGDLCLPQVWGRKPGAFAAQAVPELCRHLGDPDIKVRKAVQEPLQKIEDSAYADVILLKGQSAVPILVEQLDSEEWPKRESALRAMKALGAAALPTVQVIVRLLADESTNCREMAKSSLETLVAGGFAAADLRVLVQGVSPHFLTQLRHSSWQVRCAAAWALGQGGAGSLIGLPKIAQLLAKDKDKDWGMRVVAADLLGAIGLSAMPALPELSYAFKTDLRHLEPLRQVTYKVLFNMHRELVGVVGRAISRDPRVKEGVDRAQWFGQRLGMVTAFERDQGVNGLLEPSSIHVAGITELLRVIMDPDCPGAAQGEISTNLAIESLGLFRDKGLLGWNFKAPVEEMHMEPAMAAQDLVAELMLRTKQDTNWSVRLASAEALANLACDLQEVTACLKRHLESEDINLKAGAQRLKRKLEKENKVYLDAKAMAEQAAVEFRVVDKPNFSPGHISHAERKFSQHLARGKLQQLVECKLVDKCDADDTMELLENRQKQATISRPAPKKRFIFQQ
eukprot:TRINITY_DN36362_c0_g1_i1.p1 TRINITY_DN36362_c0_g1~~TRINITY_DN36362_c0_g1_i1.p1  ORF type:complete len:648 (-),score=152.14 TRINITY_DN36362_c0_g1_i1:159-2030(-)